MADNLYQFTGKVKLDQVFPRLFSRDFIFCFCQKNLPSFGLAKKKVFGLTLLSRKSLEKGRFLFIIIFARQGWAGARTIAVTNFKDAAISRYADILICTSQEQLMYGDAIFSRSCQILVVDMIYMGIISLDYERYTDRLKRCEKVVQEKAYGGNNPGKD